MVRTLISVAFAMVLLAVVSCGGDDKDPPSATLTGDAASSCVTADPATISACWTQVVAPGNGGFMPYAGSGDKPQWEPGKWPMTLNPVLAFNGDLWMTSSTTLSFSSSDGVNWTKHDKYETPNRLAASYAFFDGKLWLFGGNDYRTNTFSNEIWSSSDGTTWSNPGNAAWPGRDSATFITFQNKLWLLGGSSHRDLSSLVSDQFLNDVWSSDDGLNWTQVTAAAPWPARGYPRVIVRGDAMYMLGGDSHADVWKSTNGKDWTQLTPDAGLGNRQGYAAAEFAGVFWVYGGFVDTSKNGVNDIWYSSDGLQWTRQTEHAPWTPRDPISIVYKDQLFVYAGKHTGSKDSWNGDIWVMDAAPK